MGLVQRSGAFLPRRAALYGAVVIGILTLLAGVRATTGAQGLLGMQPLPNLIDDPQFEAGIAGFTAQDASSSVSWSEIGRAHV